MPRPPLPLGTMGEIRVYELPSGKFRAVGYIRDFDGRRRQLERVGKSATVARNRLREACRDRGRTDAAAEVVPRTTVAALAELWFSEVAEAVAAGERSPNTGRLYRDRIDKQVIPALGGLRLAEVSVSRVDRMLKTVRERHGLGTARATRTVLSGMFGLAVRHDAVPSNPVRDVARLPGQARTRGKVTLSLAAALELRAALAGDQRAVALDLVDLVDFLLATGLRIGEAAAVTWDAIDDRAGTVEVRGTVIRETGKGLYVKPKPKTKAGWRVIELPSWAVEMLRRRHAGSEPNEWGVVFTSASGRLRDPSNTQSDLRALFNRLGHPELTSHAFRRTVATAMDDAGLSPRAAADQLGHANVSMTTDVYFGRKVAATGAARVLEALARPNESDG